MPNKSILSLLLVGCLVGLCAAGCSKKDDGVTAVDMTVDPRTDLATGACRPDPGFASTCGFPCDKGNALGVGRFCRTLSDCSDNGRAVLCSILGDQTTHFCTFTCKKAGPSDQCGAGTSCVCDGPSCGCTPNVCLDPPDDGGTSSDGSVDAKL